MLLRDLLLQLGVNPASFTAPNPALITRRELAPLRITAPHSLDQIGMFEFGERYCVLLLSGVRVEVRDLDTLLGVVKSEFLLAETYSPEVMLAGGRVPKLVLRPKAELNRPWGRNIVKVCRDITDWVTIYNLSGEWPESVKEVFR